MSFRYLLTSTWPVNVATNVWTRFIRISETLPLLWESYALQDHSEKNYPKLLIHYFLEKNLYNRELIHVDEMIKATKIVKFPKIVNSDQFSEYLSNRKSE
jgi:hypothetical protein